MLAAAEGSQGVAINPNVVLVGAVVSILVGGVTLWKAVLEIRKLQRELSSATAGAETKESVARVAKSRRWVVALAALPWLLTVGLAVLAAVFISRWWNTSQMLEEVYQGAMRGNETIKQLKADAAKVQKSREAENRRSVKCELGPLYFQGVTKHEVPMGTCSHLGAGRLRATFDIHGPDAPKDATVKHVMISPIWRGQVRQGQCVLGERVSTFGQTDAVGRILVQTDFLFAGGDVSLVADLLACNQGKPGQQCSGNVKASVEIERLAP